MHCLSFMWKRGTHSKELQRQLIRKAELCLFFHVEKGDTKPEGVTLHRQEEKAIKTCWPSATAPSKKSTMHIKATQEARRERVLEPFCNLSCQIYLNYEY